MWRPTAVSAPFPHRVSVLSLSLSEVRWRSDLFPSISPVVRREKLSGHSFVSIQAVPFPPFKNVSVPGSIERGNEVHRREGRKVNGLLASPFMPASAKPRLLKKELSF